MDAIYKGHCCRPTLRTEQLEVFETLPSRTWGLFPGTVTKMILRLRGFKTILGEMVPAETLFLAFHYFELPVSGCPMAGKAGEGP